MYGLKAFSQQLKNNSRLLILFFIFLQASAFLAFAPNYNAYLVEEQSLVENKLEVLDKKLTAWDTDLTTYQQQLLKVDLAGLIIKFKSKSKTLASKHPEMIKLYAKISPIMAQIGNPVSSISQLKKVAIPVVPTVKSINEKIDLTQAKIAELTAKKLELETFNLKNPDSKLTALLKEFNLNHDSYVSVLIRNVFVPAAGFFILITLAWFTALRIIGRADSVEEISASLGCDDVYSFPKLGSKYKKLGQSANQMLPNALPQGMAVGKPYGGDLVLANRTSRPSDVSSEVARIKELTAEMIFKVQDKEKNIFLFSAINEGKSQVDVVSNLTVSFASMSPRVLLIDLNLKDRSLLSRFDASVTTLGFSDFLAKTPLRSCLQQSSLPGLSFLAVGKQPTFLLKHISSKLIVKKIQALSRRFDFVLINTGSMSHDLSVNFLARTLGAMFMIVDSQSDTLSVMQKNLDKLAKHNVKPEGIILDRAV